MSMGSIGFTRLVIRRKRANYTRADLPTTSLCIVKVQQYLKPLLKVSGCARRKREEEVKFKVHVSWGFAKPEVLPIPTGLELGYEARHSYLVPGGIHFRSGTTSVGGADSRQHNSHLAIEAVSGNRACPSELESILTSLHDDHFGVHQLFTW